MEKNDCDVFSTCFVAIKIYPKKMHTRMSGISKDHNCSKNLCTQEFLSRRQKMCRSSSFNQMTEKNLHNVNF